MIIRYPQEALEKAQRLRDSSEMTVRIGTSLLYRCRLHPQLWGEKHHEMRVEILPMAE